MMNSLLAKVAATGLLIFLNLISLYAQQRLPADTKITLKMENGVNSSSAAVGDTFSAISERAVRTESGVLLAGSKFEGVIVEVEPAGTNGRSGVLKLELRTVTFPDGTSSRVSAEVLKTFVTQKNGTFKALSIIGGTAIGGVIGLLGGSKGALIGAGVGAGAGTGVAVARKGKNVGIASNEEFEIRLKEDLRLPTDGF